MLQLMNDAEREVGLEDKAQIVKAEIAASMDAVASVSAATYSQAPYLPSSVSYIQVDFSHVVNDVTRLQQDAKTPEEVDMVKRVYGAFNTALRAAGTATYTVKYADGETRTLPIRDLPQRLTYPQ